ncbi:hypothetical protein IJI31_07725 [bacterium]|nr:hypothetical protein [bacterium]
MGLAASQVRMLTLTSRKAGIERDMLQGSNRKIALSREMNELANEYYNALSAEKLMYLSDSGEYKTMNYQYLMGKSGGVKGIDVKSDVSMLLIDTYSGEVVLSHEMLSKIGSVSDLRADSQNIYIAIANLCGDTNISPTIEGGIISPELIKDICAGKYDNFDANDLADVIKNPEYNAWTIGYHNEITTIPHSVPSTMLQDDHYNDLLDMGVWNRLSINMGNLGGVIEDAYLGQNETIGQDYNTPYLAKTSTGLADHDHALNSIKNTARQIGTAYFGVDNYNDLTLKQKIAVAEVMKYFGIDDTSNPTNTNNNLQSNLIQRDNYAYIYYDSDNELYDTYFDAQLFLNALYTATHLTNEEYDFNAPDNVNVHTHYNSGAYSDFPDVEVGLRLVEEQGGSLGTQQTSYSLKKLYELSASNENSLVQVGTDNSSPDDPDSHVGNFLDAVIEELGISPSNTDLNSYLNIIKNRIDAELFEKWVVDDTPTTNNSLIGPDYNDPILIHAYESELYPDLPNNDIDRLYLYEAKDPSRYYTYIDASAITNYFLAQALGENIGYGYDTNGNFQYLAPITDPETQPEQDYTTATQQTTGAYTPYLDAEKLTKLYNRMNATKEAIFASNVTVEVQVTTIVEGAGANANASFLPAGETENQWIQSFKDLIRDVKFYYPIVTACAKYGMNDNFDVNQNLKDGDYIDKNIQNGIFQLMSFDTDVFALDSAKDTDYYLLTSEFSKMNDPAQQAVITAWYETEKAEINSKETYWDTIIENLSTELNSIKTEIESVQTLIDDAVKTTFNWGKG